MQILILSSLYKLCIMHQSTPAVPIFFFFFFKGQHVSCLTSHLLTGNTECWIIFKGNIATRRDMSSQQETLNKFSSNKLWTAPRKDQYLPAYLKQICDEYTKSDNAH